MRRPFLVLSLLLTACASDDLVMQQQLYGEAGGPISVELVSFQPQNPDSFRHAETEERAAVRINVMNVSDNDLIVQRLTVRQREGSIHYSIQPASKRFDHFLGDGEDETFELIVNGRANRTRARNESTPAMAIDVAVTLATGETYHYQFGVEAPIPQGIR